MISRFPFEVDQSVEEMHWSKILKAAHRVRIAATKGRYTFEERLLNWYGRITGCVDLSERLDGEFERLRC